MKERYKSLLRGDVSDDVFIVTYSKEQLTRITEAILDDGGGREGLPPVLTHFTLAREIITASTGKPPRVIQDIEESLLAQRVVDDHQRDLRSDYRKIRDSERLHRELLETFHLLRQGGIRGERLDRLEAGVRDDRVADIIRLYRHYGEALASKGYVTYYDIVRVAAEACSELPESHALKRARVLLIDDFQDIDAGQFELLTSLAPPDGDTALNVFGDPMGAFFRSRGTHHRYLMNVFPEMYSCETVCIAGESLNDRLLGKTLEALAREVLGTGADPFVSPSPAQSDLGPLFDGSGDRDRGLVELRVARDEVEEIYSAAASVHDMITNGGLRPSEIAVVTNDKARYEIMLRAAFAQRGIAVDTGRPRQNVFRSFVHSLLTLMQSPKDSVVLQALVTSPFYEYFRLEIKELRAPRATDPAREVKNFTRALAVARLPADLQETMTRLVKKWLRPACEGYQRDTGDDSVFVFLSSLAKRWDEYTAAAEATGQRTSLKVFVRRSDLFRTTTASPMPSSDEVGLYSCRQVKGRFFRSVIVMGCSELLFPSPMRRETIIPATALQELLDAAVPDLQVRVYEARTSEEHLHDEYHLLYHSLTRARGTLCLTAPKEFAGHSLPAPSTILGENLPLSIYAEASSDQNTPPQIRFARAWVGQSEMPEIADRLTDLSPFGRLWNLARPEPRGFAIEQFPLSKSSLELYLKCPRHFFYEKVLRVKQETSDPLLVGSLFHKVMAQLADKFPSKRKLHDGANDTIIMETIQSVIEEKRDGEQTIESGSLLETSLRFHLALMVRGTLLLDAKESDDYRVAQIEQPFRLTHDGWEFRGQVDRVEKTAAGSSILDFKTGKLHKTGKTLRKYVLEALENPDKANWQVPIYVWAHRDATGELPDTFRYLAKSPGEDPFFVTLYIRRNEKDVPATSKRVSYLLEGEVKDIMDRGGEHAAGIFSNRLGFEKAADASNCRCMFDRLCERRTD
jgi:hypothetical protein